MNPTEEQFTAMQAKVRGGVVGTRNKVRRAIRPLEAAIKPAKRPILAEHCEALSKALGEPAGSNPASSPQKYRNKWEENFAYVLTLEKHVGAIKDWAYETMTLKLAKGKYHRTDFTVWHNDYSIELAQVKGYHKNIRASLTALKWAAQLNPWFRFTIKRRVGQGWESEEVVV